MYLELMAQLNDMGLELILQRTLPDHIHRPGSFDIRQLGEAPSEAQYKPIGIHSSCENLPD